MDVTARFQHIGANHHGSGESVTDTVWSSPLEVMESLPPHAEGASMSNVIRIVVEMSIADDQHEEFKRLAGRMTEIVQASEPGTLS